MHGGARYLRWLLDRFNEPRLAVAGYNAGEGTVQKYGDRVPPYQETKTYVVRVLNCYQQYRQGGLYNAAYSTSGPSSLLTMNRSGSVDGGYASDAYSRSPGVAVITTRTSNRPASLINLSAQPVSTSQSHTYLQFNSN
jgi:hypothetical protein